MRFRHAPQGSSHVVDPDRQRDASARLVLAERLGLVESNPGDADQIGLVAAEPSVHEIVGRAGLAGEVAPSELADARRGAVARHVLHHRVHRECIARVDHAQRFVPGAWRMSRAKRVAAIIDDLLDEMRLNQETAIGEDRVAPRHLQHSHRARAQRHGEIGWMLVGIETESRHVVLRIFRVDTLQDPDRHHVLGFRERGAHAHRAVEFPVVVLRFPALAAGHVGLDHDRLVRDYGGRRKALLQRRGIDERFEGGAGLAPGLGDVVELAAVEVEAADQGTNRAVARVERHERRLRLRQLHYLPVFFFVFLQPYDCATPDASLQGNLVFQGARRETQAVAGNGGQFAAP